MGTKPVRSIDATRDAGVTRVDMKLADYLVAEQAGGAVADVSGIAAIPSHEFGDCLLEES